MRRRRCGVQVYRWERQALVQAGVNETVGGETIASVYRSAGFVLKMVTIFGFKQVLEIALALGAAVAVL
jgi:hypothetical protein